MSFQDFLKKTKERNPAMARGGDARVSVSVRKVEALLESAFDAGVRAGAAEKSIFEKIFGGPAF